MSDSSSLSSDSEDDRRKTVKTSESDDSSKVKKSKKRPARNTIKNAIIESGSEESDSSSDGEGSDNRASSSRKRTKPAPKKAAPAKRKKARQSDSDSEDEMLRHLGAEGIQLTKDERAKLSRMTDLEREQFIFHKTEELEMRKARQHIEQKMKASKKGKEKQPASSDSEKSERSEQEEDNSSDSESDEPRKNRGKTSPAPVRGGNRSDSDLDAEFQRPSELAKKKQQKSALSDLLNKRREKEKKEAKKAALAVDAVFGKDKGSDDSDSSSSSSSPSSRSSSPSSRSSRARSATPDEEEAPKKMVETREELAMAKVSRFRMAKFVHAPFFKKAVVGGFVRVAGLPPSGGSGLSKIAQILDVVETAKTYNLDGQRTNKGLKLRIGGKDERVIRLEFISNQDFNEAEFNEWMTSVRHSGGTLPTVDVLEKKQKDIKEASNHVYTDAEVEAMIAEKKRFEKKTGNFAARKRQLLTEKETAEMKGDTVRAAELQRQIQDIDEHAEKLDRQRQGDIVGVTWINKRNRQQMKDALLGDRKVVDMTKGDDPFTRKSGRMKPVSGSAKDKKAEGEAATPGTPSTPAVKSNASTPAMMASSTPAGSSSLAQPTPTRDLFALHKVDIDLGDLDIGKITAKSTPLPTGGEFVSPAVAEPKQRGRLSLEDYKKRRQQQSQADN